ncbi:MAG: coagulation factor 5/8 type domain protein [Pedosphaera sp.]|nr:coagulation factor 5/8 type domain protein [Pedosphaera sp.]
MAFYVKKRFHHSMWCFAVVAFLSVAAPLQAWVPCFREFVGVNQSGTSNPLFTNAISFEREDFYWGAIAPTSNTWDTSVLSSVGQKVMAYQAQNVQFLPILDYLTDWAADKCLRSWTNGTTVYSVVPTNSGNMEFYTYVNGSLTSSSLLTSFSKFPPADVNTFSNFTYQTASFLNTAPYNVQYFQVWNEAYWNNGFWYDSMNNYFKKIVIPSSKAIRAAGGKVVYGGWPDVSTPNSLISLLDANNAWGSIDVLDMHYYNLGDVQTLRSGADARGYTNMAIWQTEVGFTTDNTYIANNFPRALYWNLTNNWTQDKYRAFYFANYSDNSSSAYGYNKCLWSGNSLGGAGIVLTNLAYVLGGTNQLSQYSGITSSPSLFPQVWPTLSSMETFGYSTSIAVIIHLNATDTPNNPTVTLTFPIALTNITSARRVDLSGVATNVTSQLISQGSGTQLTVSTADAAGSLAQTWNGASSCFYVLLNVNGLNVALNQPATASSIENSSYPAAYAVDDNGSTRWSSAYSDPQWIYVDLGATFAISRVKLAWDPAYAKSYYIQVSSDALNWTTIYSTTSGDGGVDDLTGLSGVGRYVRMYGTQRATPYGYSLYQFEVYGTLFPPTGLTATAGNGQVSLSWDASPGATSYNIKRASASTAPFTFLTNVATASFIDTTGMSGAVYYYTVSALRFQAEGNDSSMVGAASTRDLALNQPAYASSIESGSYPAGNAVDGNLSTRWSSQYADPQWIYVDLGTNFDVNGVVLTWEAAAAKSYQIQVSTNGANWSTVYSTTNGAGGTERINFPSMTARYVRLYGITRLTSYGYSLFAFQVFGMSLPLKLEMTKTGNALSLSWPADGNFTLWSTTDLMPPVSWSPVTNLIQGTNILTVTIDPLNQRQFFQLRSQ